MILKIPEDYRCDVFDANGVAVKYATWCDTETGEAVHLARDEQGFVFTVNDEGEWVVKTEWRQHPAPLTFNRRI